MTRSTLKDFFDGLHGYLTDNTPRTLLCIYESTEINYGTEEDCNVEWCRANNIPCYNIERSAGCCVNAAGNINIADIRKHRGEFVENRILHDFADWLAGKELSVELNNNDILVDGKKVAAAGGYNLTPDFTWQYTCIQFSINQDYEVIEHACKKLSTKRPGALSDYGITTDEVVEWCEKWFEDYDGGADND